MLTARAVIKRLDNHFNQGLNIGSTIVLKATGEQGIVVQNYVRSVSVKLGNGDVVSKVPVDQVELV